MKSVDIVNKLLEADVDDAESFLCGFEPSYVVIATPPKVSDKRYYLQADGAVWVADPRRAGMFTRAEAEVQKERFIRRAANYAARFKTTDDSSADCSIEIADPDKHAP